MGMRVFTAVELPPEMRTRIAESTSALLQGVRGVRAVAEESLHLTVRFLGDVAEEALPDVVAALREAVGTVPSGEAEARGFGAFPLLQRPRIVWCGVDDLSGAATELEETVAPGLAELGFERDERPFSPHVTVARLRDDSRGVGALVRRLGEEAQAGTRFGRFAVHELTVFRSDLLPGGPRYSVVDRLPLRGVTT